MTTYDPAGDPRHIPFETAPQRDDIIELGNTLVQLETADETWGRLIALFDHPGWSELTAIIASDRDAIDAAMVKALDPLEWKFLRGQRLWADFVLSLPMEAQRKRKLVVDRIKQLSDVIEGEEQASGG